MPGSACHSVTFCGRYHGSSTKPATPAASHASTVCRARCAPRTAGARIAILIALVVTLGVGLVPEPLVHVTRTAVRMTQPRPAPAADPNEISAPG